jgi:hypothetical protein
MSLSACQRLGDLARALDEQFRHRTQRGLLGMTATGGLIRNYAEQWGPVITAAKIGMD